ncbi:hypothetical protein PSSHI_44150 [Photobacterium sp. R1]
MLQCFEMIHVEPRYRGFDLAVPCVRFILFVRRDDIAVTIAPQSAVVFNANTALALVR